MSRRVLIVLVLVSSAVGWIGIGAIRVDPRIEALLPANAPSAAALLEARERYAGIAPLYLVVQSEDPAANRRIADAIRVEAERRDDIVYAITRRDPSFFIERRLLFTPTALLEEIAELSEVRAAQESCARQPGCVVLEDPVVVPGEAEIEDALRAEPRVRSLLALFGVDPDARRESIVDQASANASELCRPDGRACVVQIATAGAPNDLRYARSVVSWAQDLLERVRPADGAPGLQMRIEGRFRAWVDAESSTARDLAMVGGLALLGVLIVLGVVVGSVRTVAVLLCPLVVAAGSTLFAVWVSNTVLNVVTLGTLAILAGIGIDVGVHLVSAANVQRGPAIDRARTAVRELAPALFAATATTAIGFGALTLASFPALSQLGAVASTAIVLTTIAFVALFPPLYARFAPSVRPRRLVVPHRGPTAVGLVLAGILGMAVLGEVRVEDDLRTLTASDDPDVVAHGPALRGTDRSAVLMLADDPAALEATATAIARERPARYGSESGEANLITPRTFIPNDQPARLDAIRRIRAALESMDREVGAELRVDQPIRVDDLPSWVRELFAERDGSIGRIGFLFPGGSAYDLAAMQERAADLARWNRAHPVRFASAAARLGEVRAAVQRDLPRTLLLVLFGVVLVSILFARASRLPLPSVLGAVLGTTALVTGLTVGVFVSMGRAVSIYDLAVYPLAFGAAVDGAFYVVWASRRGGDVPLAVGAVTGASATSAVAFAALLASSHPGLVSLGVAGVVSFGAILLSNSIVLPAALHRAHRRTPEHAPRSEPRASRSEDTSQPEPPSRHT